MQVYGISYNTLNLSANQSKMTIKNRIAFEGKADTFSKEIQSTGKKFLTKFKQIFGGFSHKKIEEPRQHTPVVLNKLTPMEKIDGSDFSKLEGEIISWSGEKVIKDENGAIIRKLFSNNRKKLSYVMDYSPVTSYPVRGACYCDDGKTLSSIIEYAPNSKNFSRYFSYKEDGKTLDFEIRYDPKDETAVQKVWYEDDGVTIKKIEQK